VAFKNDYRERVKEWGGLLRIFSVRILMDGQRGLFLFEEYSSCCSCLRALSLFAF